MCARVSVQDIMSVSGDGHPAHQGSPAPGLVYQDQTQTELQLPKQARA